MLKIIWSDYLKYRADLRSFDLNKIEEIVRYSPEDIMIRKQAV